MRIGVFHHKPYYLRHYDAALVTLLERGHKLVLALPDRFKQVKVPEPLRGRRGVSTALYPQARTDGLEHAVEIVRTARDAARYLAPELRPAKASRQRAFKRLVRAASTKSRPLPEAGWVDRLEWTHREQTALHRAFEDLERLIPPDEQIMRLIDDHRLDLVLCISRVNIAAPLTDIVKAASALGVATGVAVYSWDNLTNKGVLHVRPDRLFVWNDVQVREAAELHDVDAANVAVTGAARFDSLFEKAPSASRVELLGELGLDPARATILYLGSSSFVSPHEPEFVEAWSAALRAGADPRVRDANILVRPHPGAAQTHAWSEWTPSDHSVVVTPPTTRTRDQDLFDQLWISDVVVGLNTSAEIEAAILGKPVLTVKAGALAPGQEGQLHFRYLLEEHGGFARTGENLDEHLGHLSEALGSDPMAGARRRFLESFVRPRGLDVPAGVVLADEIEALAEERYGSRAGRRLAGLRGQSRSVAAR
jgi:hypothetical protein